MWIGKSGWRSFTLLHAEWLNYDRTGQTPEIDTKVSNAHVNTTNTRANTPRLKSRFPSVFPGASSPPARPW